MMILDKFAARMRLQRNDRGASAVEYGLLIAGIAALIVVAVFALGPVVKDAFSDTCASIDSTADCGTGGTGGGDGDGDT